jgi:hypothetical protein
MEPRIEDITSGFAESIVDPKVIESVRVRVGEGGGRGG